MSDLPEWRCPDCNRLLFYGYIRHVSIKCPKCSKIYNIVGDRVSRQQGSCESGGSKCKDGKN